MSLERFGPIAVSLIAPMTVRRDRRVKTWKDDGLILRISIGLEDPEELWKELESLFHSLGT